MIIAKTDKDYDDDIENLAEKMLADFDRNNIAKNLIKFIV